MRSGFALGVVLLVLALAGGTLARAAEPPLASAAVLVVDTQTGQTLLSKRSTDVTPIASITKLMTSMVVLDAGLPLDEVLTIGVEDIDTIKGTGSRLRLGAQLTRREMLRLALMASENRAASALGRSYPGGIGAFVEAMNAKAALLGMHHTRFVDSTGLSAENVSTAEDLVSLVTASRDYPLIGEFTTTPDARVDVTPTGAAIGFRNSNALVRSGGWDILVSKTGFIREAGRCLVMLANIGSRPMAIVLLDSLGSYARMADAQRIRHWIETGEVLPMPGAGAPRTKAKVKPAAVKKPAGKRRSG